MEYSTKSGLEFEFELHDRPTTTSQQKGVSFRGGKPHFYEKSKVKTQRALYITAIRASFIRAGVPFPYFDGKVAVGITFYFGVKDKRLWGRFKPTKPDVDNSVKLLLDSLGDLHFWRDDAQVVILKVAKFYDEKSKIKIRLEEIGDEKP